VKKNIEAIGIIDKANNPFSRTEWIKQEFPFTAKRQVQFSVLIGKDIKTIANIKPENYGKYVAFVAIRWGYATIKDSKLAPTEKWLNRYNYDKYGHLKNKIVKKSSSL